MNKIHKIILGLGLAVAVVSTSYAQETVEATGVMTTQATVEVSNAALFVTLAGNTTLVIDDGGNPLARGSRYLGPVEATNLTYQAPLDGTLWDIRISFADERTGLQNGTSTLPLKYNTPGLGDGGGLDPTNNAQWEGASAVFRFVSAKSDADQVPFLTNNPIAAGLLPDDGANSVGVGFTFAVEVGEAALDGAHVSGDGNPGSEGIIFELVTGVADRGNL